MGEHLQIWILWRRWQIFEIHCIDLFVVSFTQWDTNHYPGIKLIHFNWDRCIKEYRTSFIWCRFFLLSCMFVFSSVTSYLWLSLCGVYMCRCVCLHCICMCFCTCVGFACVYFYVRAFHCVWGVHCDGVFFSLCLCVYILYGCVWAFCVCVFPCVFVFVSIFLMSACFACVLSAFAVCVLMLVYMSWFCVYVCVRVHARVCVYKPLQLFVFRIFKRKKKWWFAYFE